MPKKNLPRRNMPMEQYLSQAPSQRSDSSAPSRNYEPARWKPQYDEILRLHVQGMPVALIQRKMRAWGIKAYSSAHIYRIIESRRGRERASMMSAYMVGGKEGLRDYLENFFPDAIGTEMDIWRHPYEETRHRLNALQDFMDRVGFPKQTRQEVVNQTPQTIVINLLPSQMSSFLQPPPAIEAEVVEIRGDLPSSANK